MYVEIKTAAENATRELVKIANMKMGDIFVVGCASSAILGHTIGTTPDPDIARAAHRGIISVLEENGIYLASQCSAHLNRALVIERKAAEKYGFEIVSVVPTENDGSSFAMKAYNRCYDPVVVESINHKATAGIDIGGVLIGMHLKPVAVPAPLSITKIGDANIICAYSRPKYIGGNRAVYY